MTKYVNEDGTFVENWTEQLPPDSPLKPHTAALRDFKSIEAVAKAFVDTKAALGGRVEVPKDPAGRREFMAQHFKSELEADEQARKRAAEQAQARQAEEAERAKTTQREASAQTLKEHWGKDYDTNLELVRRAVRSEHVNPMTKELIARAAGVEPGELTDDQIKDVLAHDPACSIQLLDVANLTKDGRMETGDGHRQAKQDEKRPGQPTCPEIYKNLPDTDPEKRWFINRGYNYATGDWDGPPPR